MRVLYDLVIVGGGAAGLTAALYASRSGLDCIVLDPSSPEGSSIALTDAVENYTGFSDIAGFDLIQHFYSHAKSFGANFVRQSLVGIRKIYDGFILECSDSEVKTKSVILCMGATHKKLGIDGENKFEGRGVSYCAVCDGYFFKDKTVAVIGGGNTAVTEATYLSHICKRVILIHRGDALKADRVLVQKLEKSGNVKIFYNTNVVKIDGDEKVKSVTLDNEKIMKTDGVFVAVGLEPRTECVKGFVKTDDNGSGYCRRSAAPPGSRSASERQWQRHCQASRCRPPPACPAPGSAGRSTAPSCRRWPRSPPERKTRR